MNYLRWKETWGKVLSFSWRQHRARQTTDSLLPFEKRVTETGWVKSITLRRIGTGLIGIVGVGILAKGYSWIGGDIESKVAKKFKIPEQPTLIREGEHFSREKEEKEIKEAFLNRTDTLGLVGVIFGPAGTGKSNLVRTVCRPDHKIKCEMFHRKRGRKGVIYIEVGSHRMFAYNLAKNCGIKIEPNILDVAISYVAPGWKTHLTLPDDEVDALAYITPVIEKGGKKYKKKNRNKVPVLFIDGVDILAKHDSALYKSLVDWAKKCANDDSLQVVLVSSDSHTLALDQQSFKSRLDDLIEIGDIEDEETQEHLIKIFKKKGYGLEKLQDCHVRELMEENSWRLADIHKALKTWIKTSKVIIDLPKSDAKKNLYDSLKEYVIKKEKLKDEREVSVRYPFITTDNQIKVPKELAEIVGKKSSLSDEVIKKLKPMSPEVWKPENLKNITKDEEKNAIIPILLEYFEMKHFFKELKARYTREMEHALSNALGDAKSDQWELHLAVIKEVLDQDKDSKPHKDRKTVEQITWTVINNFKAKKTHYSTNDVQEVIKAFLRYNVLRITKHRTLLCYNQFSKQVLNDFIQRSQPAKSAMAK